MSRESKTKQQFASWISKNRWAPLLTWFNQNDSKQEYWSMLFSQAQMYGLQEKWPHYMSFFKLHFDHKTHKDMPLAMHAGMAEQAWTLLNVAMPLFFVPALPLLSRQQSEELKGNIMEWFLPWLPTFNGHQSTLHRQSLVTVFRTLVNMDALPEWKALESLIQKEDLSGLIQYTRGRNISWKNTLREMHLAQGATVVDWHKALFKSDCVEHLLTESTALPVSKAFLSCVLEHQTKGLKADDAMSTIFKRHPHFRIWLENATGDDAQTGRAILGIIEFETTIGIPAQKVQIGKSLGLSIKDVSTLLDESTCMADMGVDGVVFEDGPLARL